MIIYVHTDGRIDHWENRRYKGVSFNGVRAALDDYPVPVKLENGVTIDGRLHKRGRMYVGVGGVYNKLPLNKAIFEMTGIEIFGPAMIFTSPNFCAYGEPKEPEKHDRSHQ